MKSPLYLDQLCVELSKLYSFARQINELDFAAALNGEARGAQDGGWSTTITAHQVHEEFVRSVTPGNKTVAQLRYLLMLYCQLAEAGGVYETLKNMMGVVQLKPYVFWPFQELVRVRQSPRAVIGPNANQTFRDLATTAQAVGLPTLSRLLAETFRDDIRNGLFHGDYVIWNDGLRLRKRNGGRVTRLSFEELNDAMGRGVGFFDVLTALNQASMETFDPPKTIIGRFSANPPMPWTVTLDRERGSFGLSSSSPGIVKDAAYDRQQAINGLLGGKMLSTFQAASSNERVELTTHIQAQGFVPNQVVLSAGALDALLLRVEDEGLWDLRGRGELQGGLLLASPWGFKYLSSPADFDALIPEPIIKIGTPPAKTEERQSEE